jgi:hypothetical protein
MKQEIINHLKDLIFFIEHTRHIIKDWNKKSMNWKLSSRKNVLINLNYIRARSNLMKT